MKPFDYRSLPETPGVYIMKDAAGAVLYVGKAVNLRRRVSSYFERPNDARMQTLVARIAAIDHRDTDTAIEALILEAALIRKFSPPFNVKEKDDKSFLFIEITKEKFPRVVLVRGRDITDKKGRRFGPFTSASSAREALKILRKIFPWSTHDPERLGTFKRPCFDYEIGLCPGTCIGAISRKDYLKTIANLKLFLQGKKSRVVKNLEREMMVASKKLEFEAAEKLRRQIFALKHIEDTALVSDSGIVLPMPGNTAARPFRIEGYDISNISGTSAVGSMVVFEDGKPNKNEYRKFKIRTVAEPNDVGMLTEVLVRRFRHDDWISPDLILIDGGMPQVHATYRAMRAAGRKIPIVGLAKGPERKRNDIIGAVPKNVSLKTLIQVRDEAHRFAIKYHKALRRVKTFE